MNGEGEGGGNDPTLNPEAPLKPKPGFVGWVLGVLHFKDISVERLQEYEKQGVATEVGPDGKVTLSVHTMVPPEKKKKGT